MTQDIYPLFVLTMPGDESRRAPLLDWLAAHGIDYELQFGVDGREGLAAKWEASIDRETAARRLGRPMGNGEFGCALSHQEIYRTVLDRGLPGAVILEDDARPTEAFAGFLADRAYLRAQMILLDHSNTRVVRGSACQIAPGLAGYRVALPPILSTGYSVSSKAAALIRKWSLPISLPADWPCDICDIGAMALMPRPVGHPKPTPGHSRLEHERVQPQLRWGRFLSPAYWRRWWRKRTSLRLPEAS